MLGELADTLSGFAGVLADRMAKVTKTAFVEFSLPDLQTLAANHY